VSDAQRFCLPDLGEGLTEAEVVAWRVAPGDTVVLNQILLEVETEKATVELPSPWAGTVHELFAGPGDTVRVGAPLVAIAAAVPMLVGYGPAAPPPSRRSRRARGGVHQAPPTAGTPGSSSAPPHGRPLAAPPVRFMARQHGVDLADVAGRGPGGIVTRDDLAAHLGAQLADTSGGAPGDETRAPLRGVRKHMAEAMVRSVAAAPQACVFLTVDATPTTELVAHLRDSGYLEGTRVTPLTVVARAAVLALGAHPALNASWDEATAEEVTKHYVNLGVAVAGPRGLVVPNVKGAHEMSLRALARALDELTGRARAGRSTPDELRGGTATVTNVGVFRVDGGVPILNPGQASILALGAVRRRPWEHRGAVALRDVVTLSVAFDHRLVDGEQASRFLCAVGEVLADPTALLAFA
jgi:2-oxoisovalerate dehydrogenase E2 component (dihydrolipoyl transacylase)